MWGNEWSRTNRFLDQMRAEENKYSHFRMQYLMRAGYILCISSGARCGDAVGNRFFLFSVSLLPAPPSLEGGAAKSRSLHVRTNCGTVRWTRNVNSVSYDAPGVDRYNTARAGVRCWPKRQKQKIPLPFSAQHSFGTYQKTNRTFVIYPPSTRCLSFFFLRSVLFHARRNGWVSRFISRRCLEHLLCSKPTRPGSQGSQFSFREKLLARKSKRPKQVQWKSEDDSWKKYLQTRARTLTSHKRWSWF